MARRLALMGAAIASIGCVLPGHPIGAAAPALAAAGAPIVDMAEARRSFQRNCASCHMAFGASFGGQLVKDIVNEREDEVRTVILEGGTKMPAFKYMIDAKEADALIAYIKTVEVAPETLAAEQPEPWSGKP